MGTAVTLPPLQKRPRSSFDQNLPAKKVMRCDRCRPRERKILYPPETDVADKRGEIFPLETGIYARACFSTFAILAGTPNSLRHTSASAATPSRICSWDGLAKHSRNRLPA